MAPSCHCINCRLVAKKIPLLPRPIDRPSLTLLKDRSSKVAGQRSAEGLQRKHGNFPIAMCVQ